MTMTIKSTELRSRVEPDLKDSAAEVLAQCGLTLSDAIRLFLRQVVLHNGLPFEVKVPTAETRAAMEEARSITRARFHDGKALIDDLETKSRPRKARR